MLHSAQQQQHCGGKQQLLLGAALLVQREFERLKQLARRIAQTALQTKLRLPVVGTGRKAEGGARAAAGHGRQRCSSHD